MNVQAHLAMQHDTFVFLGTEERMVEYHVELHDEEGLDHSVEDLSYDEAAFPWVWQRAVENFTSE